MEAEIEQLLAESSEAVGHRDGQRLAQLMHPNANYPLPTGEVVVGRKAIAAAMTPLLQSIPSDVVQETVSQRIHRVTPDLALIDTVGMNVKLGRNGDCEHISTEAFTLVAVREAGAWFLAGIRAALPPKA